MNFIKKTIVYSIIITAFTSLGFCQGFPSSNDFFPYSGTDIPQTTNPIIDTDIDTIISNNIQDTDNGLNRLLRLFMPNSAMYDEGNGPSILFYLKTLVNLLLSFVSLIALILIIYAFYMIFFKKDEAGFSAAKQIIKGVVIALFIIGLSRIIVSFLFRFKEENTQNLGLNNNPHIQSNIG